MSFIFTDRESGYPNRYRLIRENGTTEFVILERADEPVVVGTPLNADTFNTLLAEFGSVKAVNGIAPDENGNVTLPSADEVSY